MSADQIEWRQWGDECVVFNGVTASTHLLGDAASAVLQLLLQTRASLTSTQIFEKVFSGGGADSAVADELAALETILADFERFRIVCRVTS